MNKTDQSSASKTAENDSVLLEVWQAKDALSEAYGHDLDRLFAETRKRQETARHSIVDLSRPVANPA